MKKLRAFASKVPSPEQWPARTRRLHPLLGPLLSRFASPLLNPDFWGKRVTLDLLEADRASLRIYRPDPIDLWLRGGLTAHFFVGAAHWLVRALMAQHLVDRVHQSSVIKSQVVLDRPPKETVFLRAHLDLDEMNEWLWRLQHRGWVDQPWRLSILNKKQKQMGEVELTLRIEGALMLASSKKKGM